MRFGVCYGFLPFFPPFLLLLGSCIVTVVCVFVLPTDLQSDYINEMKKSSRVIWGYFQSGQVGSFMDA